MKRRSSFFVLNALLVLLLATATASAAARGQASPTTLGTSFSYEGRLNQAGQPVNGSVDFQFILYNAPSGGSQIGVQIVRLDRVLVTNGLFSVSLDFGPVFEGTPLYLEVGVKPAASSDPYTVLLPRQALESTPYALYAQRAQSVDTIPLSGSGDAATAAHSDHTHFGQVWHGAGDAALTVQNAGGGHGYGVYALTDANNGTAVRGQTTQPDGLSYGIYGASTSTQGRGVFGIVGGTDRLPTPLGIGVEGRSVVPNGTSFGVVGVADSSEGVGVSGSASARTGATRGVSGSSNSPSGIGVYGRAFRGGNAIVGEAETQGSGIVGRNGTVPSVIAEPLDLRLGAGVFGEATDLPGVKGISSHSYGVYGYSTNGYAGYFNGSVNVTGNLTKAGGSFKIDHPLDPTNKYLSHSFVESPDMKNIYDGVVTLDAAGAAVVTLPEWFEALNQDFRYQLTAIDAPGPNLYIAEKIKNNRFTIAGGVPGMEVSWLVTGIRHDAWANAHRIPVEEKKPTKERGTYLHPAEQGQPELMGVDYAERQRLEQVQQSAGER